MSLKHSLPRSLGLERNPKVNHCISSCRALRYGHPVFAWILPVIKLVTCLEQFFHLEQHDGWKSIMSNKKIYLLAISISFSWFCLKWLNLTATTQWGSHGLMHKFLGVCFSFLSFLKHSFDYIIPQYKHFQWLPHCQQNKVQLLWFLQVIVTNIYPKHLHYLLLLSSLRHLSLFPLYVSYLYICQLPPTPLWHP